MDPRQGTVLAYIAHSLLKAMEVSEEKKPPVYPDMYRGLTVVKRTFAQKRNTWSRLSSNRRHSQR